MRNKSSVIQKYLLFFAVNMVMCFGAYAQQSSLFGQYYKAIQMYAPALNGAQEYLDVSVGSRKQWTSINNAPTVNIVNLSSPLNINRRNPYRYNSARVSNLAPYDKKNVKLGIGGYFVNSTFGSLVSNSFMGVFSSHVLIDKNAYLSFGVSLGLRNQRLNLEDLFVLNPDNDLVYQDYLSSNGRALFLDSNIGLSFHSSRLYFSYTLMKVANELISGYSSAQDFSFGAFDHNFLGGMRLSLNQNLDIIPNFFFRYSDLSPNFLDLGIRASYRNGCLGGISYRTDGSIISMLGLEFKRIYEIGYAFEFKEFSSEFDVLNTHEVTLGIKLFDHKTRKPVW